MDLVEKLAAIEDIKNLKARYFRLVDSKQYEALEALFMPDVAVDHSQDHPQAVFNNRSDWVALIRSGMAPTTSVHHGHTPEIEITSPTAALGIWPMQDWIWWPPEVTSPIGTCAFAGFGHYHETYLKTAEGWRIASVRLRRIRLDRDAAYGYAGV
jgi:SnoaL-like domain